jgi:hypothetical protein
LETTLHDSAAVRRFHLTVQLKDILNVIIDAGLNGFSITICANKGSSINGCGDREKAGNNKRRPG